MKKVIILLASLSVLATIGGCRKDIEPAVAPTGSNIVISADISGVDIKASKTAFKAGDTLGMWVVPYSNSTTNTPSDLRPSGNYVDNVKYKHDGITFNATADVFYPSAVAKVDLYAVYPYSGAMSAKVGNTMTDPKAYAWAVKQKQIHADSIVLSDILTAFFGAAVQGGTPALDFKHRLSQVLVKFNVPKEYKDKAVKGVKLVEVIGVRLKSTVNIVDTAAAPIVGTDDALNPKADITAFQSSKPAAAAADGDYVYEAIVVPQTIGSGSSVVRITLDVTGLGDVLFDCKISADHDYLPKYSTTINVNIVGQQAIVLNNNDITISGWQKTTDITGGTIKLCRMIFNVIDNGSVANFDKAKAAKLTIDGKEYPGTVTYNAADGQYIIEYDQTGVWGGRLQKIELTDGATTPATILAEQTLFDDGFQIKGDPTSDAYATVIGTIVFNSSANIQILNSATETLVDNSAKAANCYVIKADEAVIFNAKVKGNGTAANLATTSVKIVWQGAANGGLSNGGNLVLNNNKNIAYDAASGKVTVAANNVNGNAVVGAYDVSNNLLWSWHIWVSPTALNAMTAHVYGAKFTEANGAGISILDRNLGATSAVGTLGYVQSGGMLYQWGRKDPFAGAANATGAVKIYDDKGNAVNYKVVVNALDNSATTDATTLFYSTLAGKDWTVKNDNLWASSNKGTSTLPKDNKGAKSLTDPCPAGYRVATGGADSEGTWGELGSNGTVHSGWTGTGTVNAGYNFAANMLAGNPWYAAAGYRTQSGITGAGTMGVVWSSSVPAAGEDALGLQFTQQKVNSNANINRSAACAVRCVQE